MFEWTWDSIAAECSNFLGPAGYGYVQVSPPAEHITGSQWWTDYQPVSYNLTSKRGNRSQFQNMISTCHSAGVKVIVDTIFNHMSAGSGTGTGGSSYTKYNYLGIYQDQNFHPCRSKIYDYSNRAQVQTCELVGLADLATETTYVRSRLAAYANDLLSLGVDGLRLDASKHMAASDLASILSQLTRTPYITQEVIYGPGEAVQPSEYTGNGDVQEFRYTSALKDAFSGSGISRLQNLDSNGWISGSGANVFVANHDTERNGASLNYRSPSNTYVTATIFSLAHPYGTPTILSSYSFSGTDDGSPNGGTGTCSTNGGSNGWLCQHRLPAVRGMVGFRNTVGSAPLVNWVSPQSQQIAFGRGSAGFVAINNVDSVWTTDFTTTLPSGTYCDVISGGSSSGTCTGSSFTVVSGSFKATVPARSAIAIHTAALGSTSSSTSSAASSTTSSSVSTNPTSTSQGNNSTTSTSSSTTTSATTASTVTVTFAEQATTTYGQNIFLVGSISQLQNWDPNSAIALSAATYPIWKVVVNIPANTNFQYKFIRKETNGRVVWESDPNRQATTGNSGSQTISTTWR